MVKKDWMDKAVKREGAFAAKASRAGKSTKSYATEVVRKLKGKTENAQERRLLRQAVLAKTFQKYKPKKILKPSQAATLAKHKEHHTSKHMTIMKKEMMNGKTFKQSHTIAMKKHGK